MAGQNPQQPKRLPAAQGWAWLKSSLAILRAQPARLMLIAVILQFILGLSRLPLMGLLIILAVPALTAGLLQAIQQAAKGQRPAPGVLFSALASRPRTGRLFLLGLILFAAGLLTISVLLSGAAIELDPALVARLEGGDMEAVKMLDPQFVSQLMVALAVAFSVSGTLSFLSIPLIWFSNESLGASIRRGIRGLIVNWKPFGVMGLGLALLSVPVMLLFRLVFEAAGPGGPLSVLVLGSLLVVVLAFQMLLFGTQYCSFRDIFPDAEAPADVPDAHEEDRTESGDKGQLVA